MSLRDFLQKINVENKIITVNEPISKDFEIAGVLKKIEPTPVLFNHLVDSGFPVVGNLFCTKQAIASYLNISSSEMIPRLSNAIDHKSPCEITQNAPCQEVIQDYPDLDTLPLLWHTDKDGGRYISSGVVFANHPLHGQNVDFHRCMQISKNQMAVRIVRGRHLDTYLRNLQTIDVAICIGVPPTVLVSAATSVELGINELEIANALEHLQVVKAQTVDVWIPAESEFVLEGTIHLENTHAEGPFVDLTETLDIIRQEPVLEIKKITHRKNAIWQALLPGGLEHKLLMGMPREPTIFKKVNEVVQCLDVHINPGGCSWLHAIVQINKQHEEDGKKAIHAAFAGHSSCKHVFVVDSDIDIYNPQEVEWALATRFQGDKKLVIKEKERGSSLDPSADPKTNLTTKIGFDLTAPLSTKGKTFSRANYPEVDISRFIKE